MWWNPRLYALLCCLGLLARWSYRGALRELEGEMAGTEALLLFWIPLVGVVAISLSYLTPTVRRFLANRRDGRGG